MKLIFTLLLAILAGCASEKKDPIIEDVMKLDARKVLYQSKLTDRVSDGFINPGDCDGSTFNALAVAAGVSNIDLGLVEDEGKFYRRPSRDCLQSGESKSECSRDVYLMQFIRIWKFKDLPAIERIIQHGESNDWVMCDHDGSTDGKSRVYMTPQLQAIAYQIRHKLGGADHGKRLVGQTWPKTSGFESHLQVLRANLVGEVYGKISATARDRVQVNRDRNPGNAIFQAVASKYGDGDQKNAVQILLNESLFPADKLPTAANYCAEYLFQREQYVNNLTQTYTGEPLKFELGGDSSDWKPCEKEGDGWRGLEWLVAYEIANGSL